MSTLSTDILSDFADRLIADGIIRPEDKAELMSGAMEHLVAAIADSIGIAGKAFKYRRSVYPGAGFFNGETTADPEPVNVFPRGRFSNWLFAPPDTENIILDAPAEPITMGVMYSVSEAGNYRIHYAHQLARISDPMNTAPTIQGSVTLTDQTPGKLSAFYAPIPARLWAEAHLRTGRLWRSGDDDGGAFNVYGVTYFYRGLWPGRGTL